MKKRTELNSEDSTDLYFLHLTHKHAINRLSYSKTLHHFPTAKQSVIRNVVCSIRFVSVSGDKNILLITLSSPRSGIYPSSMKRRQCKTLLSTLCEVLHRSLLIFLICLRMHFCKGTANCLTGINENYYLDVLS